MTTQIEPLKQKLAPLYGADMRWSFAHECLLLELHREPTHMAEIDRVVTYHASLKPHELRFFPQTMTSLLTNWPDLMCKVSVWEKTKDAPKPLSATEKGILARELSAADKRIAILRQIRENITIEKPTPAHKVELDALKARRLELMNLLGMKA